LGYKYTLTKKGGTSGRNKSGGASRKKTIEIGCRIRMLPVLLFFFHSKSTKKQSQQINHKYINFICGFVEI